MSRSLSLILSTFISCGLIALLSTANADTLYESVTQDAQQISHGSLAQPLSPESWKASEKERREQWLEMLGLSPLPEKTPLHATVTGTLDRGDYVVEKIHFQSAPGAYVIGNLYRPAKIEGPLPAVLYLCGHSYGKVSPTYQANPRWFAQHGYVALVLDPIQLGESQGFHHGTHRSERWDWQSRGYTPLGTEVWNGMRALDYLISRPDVDADRLGVTGLSGGGVVSWALGAADTRLKVVVPVCQSGSILDVVMNRSTDGHCDCAFWINYHRWCWPDLGSLIAPRAFQIASGSEDVLWRPTGYRDTAYRIRLQYNALNAGDHFDLVEDETPHGYTPKLRKAIFTWFNTHLKNDSTPVKDDVTDFVEPTENLLVFGGKLPEDDKMGKIDTVLVHREKLPEIADEKQWNEHQKKALAQLLSSTFRNTLVGETPRLVNQLRDGTTGQNNSSQDYSTHVFDTRDGLELRAKIARASDAPDRVPAVAFAVQPDAPQTFVGGRGSRPNISSPLLTYGVEVRNTGLTSVGPGYLWTLRRTYPLLGESLAERQTQDLLDGVALLRSEIPSERIAVYGDGETAPLAIYATLLDPEISEVILTHAPESHEANETATYLGVLRVGDLPHNLALIYPRPITFVGALPPAYEWTRDLYKKLGKEDRFRVIQNIERWVPYKAK